MTIDEKYMRQAVTQAKKAGAVGEVPIGCVIVYEDKVIARGYNRRTSDKMCFPMQKLLQSAKPVKSWETGDWRTVPCM